MSFLDRFFWPRAATQSSASEVAMSWLSERLSWLTAPWSSFSDMQADVAAMRLVLLAIPTRLTRMEKLMAADRDLLAQIAEDLTALATPVADLIASEKALRARVVELEGAAAADEAGDLAAAGAVKTAFDQLAGKFAAEPDVPDVEPLPGPVDVPAADPTV